MSFMHTLMRYLKTPQAAMRLDTHIISALLNALCNWITVELVLFQQIPFDCRTWNCWYPYPLVPPAQISVQT